MNLFKNTIAAGALAFAAMAPAQASNINVGGVIWNPDAVNDFSAFSLAIQQSIDPVTGVVSGWGMISTMNSTGQTVFCPGCELTFQYGGFAPITSGALPTTPGTVVGYTGGFVNFYVDSTPEITNPADVTSLTFANTGDGDLWLALVGNEISGTTLTGTVLGVGSDIAALFGGGLLDVTGGLAAGNFDTNQEQDGADVSFSNSFTQFNPDNNTLNASGTGNLVSHTIPEPASLALLGAGLLGLAALRKRKSA